MHRTAAIIVTLFALAQDRIEGRRDRGATAVEYGLMVGLIAVAIILTVTLLGEQLNELFTGVTDQLPAPAAP